MVKFCNISLIYELSLIGPKRKNVVFRPQDNNKMLLVKYEILDIYREIYISGFGSCEIICSRFPTPPPIRHLKDYFKVSFFYLYLIFVRLNAKIRHRTWIFIWRSLAYVLHKVERFYIKLIPNLIWLPTSRHVLNLTTKCKFVANLLSYEYSYCYNRNIVNIWNTTFFPVLAQGICTQTKSKANKADNCHKAHKGLPLLHAASK